MDKIILAMLFLRSRTLYELKVKFSGDLGLLYSGSTGSIQAALKKLLAAGLICCSETVENGRLKKIHEITDTGREEFRKWINSPFDGGGNRNPELAKLYFMGLSDRESRAGRIRSHIADVSVYHASLQAVYEDGQKLLESVPPEYTDLLRFQMVTTRHGIDLAAFEMQWLQQLLEDMENERI